MQEKVHFPKEKGLETYSAIYVPSTQDVNKKITPAQHQRRANEVRNFMNKQFGGTTSVRALGSYTDSKGRVVNEPVIVVENFSDIKDYEHHDRKIHKFVQSRARSWGQESVSYEFEAPRYPRRLVFVAPDKPRSSRKLREIS